MYQSVFSYNITRPYPFRWFTPATIIGGIIATALISFINVAANGYELSSLSSSNPNATLTAQTWFGKFPSFLVSTRAKCESATIPLQTRIYTNNTAFPYILYSVWQMDNNKQRNVLGSLVYNNQALNTCNISSTVDFDFNANNRAGGQMALIPVGATITTQADCAIDNPQGRTYFTLYGTYDPIPPPSDPSGGFLARNKSTKASLFWGESIMRLYWANLMQEYHTANTATKGDKDDKHIYTNGVANFVRAAPGNSIISPSEAMSLGFFNIWCGFNTDNNTGGIEYYTGYCNEHNKISNLSTSSLMPNIWPSMNVLGKAVYFSVLADLGRSGVNILSDPILLANLTSNLTTVNQTLGHRFRQWIDDGLEQVSFDPASMAQDWDLGVNPAVLTTTYICQVPRIKNGGALFVSVLVADLVLLQGIWMVFRLVVDNFWVKKQVRLRSCEGCAGAGIGGGAETEMDELLVDRSREDIGAVQTLLK